MAKKFQDGELSVAERLGGALKLIQDQAGPGSGRRGSGVGSGRRT